MRHALIGFGVLLAAWTMSVQPGSAAAWCALDGPFSRGGTLDCSFHTYAQCRAMVWGAGGTCMENPRWGFARRVPPPPRRYRYQPY